MNKLKKYEKFVPEFIFAIGEEREREREHLI